MPTALVVDDDRGFRERLAVYLRGCGAGVTTVRDFDEMTEAFSTELTDWVVFEPNLPSCHWYRVMTALAPRMDRGRWLAVTAFPSQALVEWMSRTDRVALLCKPVTPPVIHGVLMGEVAPPRPGPWPARPLSLARAEWEHLNSALAACDGNVSVAARRLAIPRQTLYRKLRTHPPPG
jgi:two-component system response regulator RegA